MPCVSLLRAPQYKQRRRAELNQLALPSQRRSCLSICALLHSNLALSVPALPPRGPAPLPAPPSTVCASARSFSPRSFRRLRQDYCALETAYFYPVGRFLVHSTRSKPAPYRHQAPSLGSLHPSHPMASALSALAVSDFEGAKSAHSPDPPCNPSKSRWMSRSMTPAKWQSHSRSWYFKRPIIPPPT